MKGATYIMPEFESKKPYQQIADYAGLFLNTLHFLNTGGHWTIDSLRDVLFPEYLLECGTVPASQSLQRIQWDFEEVFAMMRNEHLIDCNDSRDVWITGRGVIFLIRHREAMQNALR